MTKKIFYDVYLVGLGKEFVNNHNIDTYLILLAKELQKLWKQVNAWDVTYPIKTNRFTFHVIQMWRVHGVNA
jgi:hypothetical protein